MNTKKMDNIFNRTVKAKHIYEAVLLVENRKGDVRYQAEYGGKQVDSPLLLASITKLFTTACILILQEQGKLTLDDHISAYIDENILRKLHIFKGNDYSSQLKISSLLFQTSGLADIFEEGNNPVKMSAIREDMSISFEEIINLTKQIPPHMAPDSIAQAHYADINFDLLGIIIEKITNRKLEEVYHSLLFEPLELIHTYLPISNDDFVPIIYYNDTKIHRPKYIQSCRASGGAISTANELMSFTKAFFNGKLFDQQILQQLSRYNRLQRNMFPIQYGGGYMRISLKGPLTLFMGKGELIGHSGSSGSFAYYYPHKDLFIVGDINQITKPAVPIRLMIQVASAL